VFGVLASVGVGIASASLVPLDAWQGWHTPALLGACAALIVLAVLVAQRKDASAARWGCALLAAAVLGAGAWGVRVVSVPSRVLPVQAGSIVVVEGVVLEGQRALAPRSSLAGVPQVPATMLTLSLRSREQAGERVPARGTLRVRIAGVQTERAGEPGVIRFGAGVPGAGVPGALVPGTAVRVLGRYEPPKPATNPGEPDREVLARARGDAGTLALSGADLLTPLDSLAHARWGDGVRSRVLALRERGREAVLASLPSEPQARWLLSLLLLGESETRDDQTLSAFARVGIIHLVAISGFHLTIIAMVALWMLRLLGDRGWLEPMLVALALVAYASLTPLSPALLRAVLLTLLVLASQSVGRRPDTLCALGLGATLLLLVQPHAWNDLGLQLSLGLTALLLWAQEPFASRFARLPPKGVVLERLPLPARLWRGARTLSAASVMCWIVSAPWLMASVGLLSPIALLASLVLAPVFVVLLVVGVLASVVVGVLGAIAPAIGVWLAEHVSGPVLASLSLGVVQSVRFFDSVPLAWTHVPVTPWWWAALASAALALWARFGLARFPREVPRRVVAIPLLLAACTLPLSWHLRSRLPSDVLLRIDMLDVGDGTCMLLRTQDQTLLWDAKPARWARTSPGVLAACRALGVWRVPTLLLTHPDSDHCAGVPELLQPLGVQHVLLTERFLESAQGPRAQPLPTDVLRTMREAGLVPRALARGDELVLGAGARPGARPGARSSETPIVASVIWPPRTTMDDAASGVQASELSDNDTSLVLLLALPLHNGATAHVLLTGDVQNDAARAVARRIAPLAPLAAMEAPHHGAANPGGIELLSTARARVVLQSTGPSRVLDPRLDAPRSHTAHWLATPTTGWTQLSILSSGDLHIQTQR
jgi:competence protein ComEC